MEQQLAKMQKEIVRLKWYAGILTLVVAVGGLVAFTNTGISRFKEISASRINILEDNGQVRMVISNKDLSPQCLQYGKPFSPPIAGGNRPGIIFYNDEGTENGGLVFMGHKDSTGKYVASGHLSFDQYNQNQVLYLTYADENGDQNTGLHIDDWQTSPPFWEFRAQYKKLQQLPASASKDQLLNKLLEPQPGKAFFSQRIFVGKDATKTAMVMLADRMGKPRLQLLVDSNGIAKLNFLDQQGKVTYSLPK